MAKFFPIALSSKKLRSLIGPAPKLKTDFATEFGKNILGRGTKASKGLINPPKPNPSAANKIWPVK